VTVTIHVGRLAPPGMWDTNLVELLLSNRLYPTGLDFKRSLGYPNAHGCVLIVPGKYWTDHTDQISEALATYEWVLAFRTSDEEDWFDIHRVTHPNIRWWVQYPRTDRDYGDARLLGAGFTPHFNKLPADAPAKDLDLFLSAQRTHIRREQAFDTLEQVQSDNILINPTDGFTRGMIASAYCDAMMRAKVAPAPSGAQTPDSFRLWEALESHTVPIADDISPVYESAGFWRNLLPGAPFMVFDDYEDLPALIEDELRDWPWGANRIAAWWMRTKRQHVQWLREDLEELGAL
jgi:hypothetical protein